jgi:hypothetical protein
MKHLIAILAIIALTGCSNLYNSTPEWATAVDVYHDVDHLAVQVRGADRESKADEVRGKELFFANCDTYSRTVADLLVNDYGADPADVWLVQVRIPVKGFVWEKVGNKWIRIKSTPHQIVMWQDIVIDNLWGVVPVKSLEWRYRFDSKMSMEDPKWVAF